MIFRRSRWLPFLLPLKYVFKEVLDIYANGQFPECPKNEFKSYFLSFFTFKKNILNKFMKWTEVTGKVSAGNNLIFEGTPGNNEE